MNHLLRTIPLLALWLALGACAIAQPAAQPTTQPSVTTTEPFVGVTHIHRTATDPRPMNIHVIQIDLNAPGIRFKVTPGNDDAPRETELQTTPAFLVQQKAQLAINTHFFSPFPPNAPQSNVIGLAASEGDVYSPFQNNWPAVNISKDHVVTFHDDPPGEDVEIYNAVAGNERILRHGENVARDKKSLHPRTGIGLSDDGETLILITVDGRREGFSEGVTTVELADLLREHGAHDAVNLDGGGSTTMAMADPTPRLVNVPSSLTRPVGCNLAVFADPQEEKDGP